MPLSLLDAGVSAIAVVVSVAVATVASLDPAALPRHARLPVEHTVEIDAGTIDFAEPGEFLAAGRPVAPEAVRTVFAQPFRVMRHQVSQADYQFCVAAGACQPSDATPSATPERIPITGVSYLDATAYAEWLADATGEGWRLPTAAEWAFMAAERFSGDVYSPVAEEKANPSVAWIRRYREEAAAARSPDPQVRPHGFFGPNSRAVEDLAGNVWEWTSTCYTRFAVDENSQPLTRVDNCGVHVVEGRHRAYMSNFIRDGKSGGCAVGTPPQNLGFRLVLEEARAEAGV
jgi:formylglycine-generating enzyme required for sulfatase activity